MCIIEFCRTNGIKGKLQLAVPLLLIGLVLCSLIKTCFAKISFHHIGMMNSTLSVCVPKSQR